MTVGVSSMVSTWEAWHGSSQVYINILLTDWQMVHTISIEAALLGLLFVHLHRRGWRPADLRIKPTLVASGQGLGLVLAMALANLAAVVSTYVILFVTQSGYHTFTAFLMANSPHVKYHSLHLSWLSILPAMILNGFYEEITCMGYAFNQLATKLGPFFALLLTVLLRMSCHTYQGLAHAIGIGAVFFVSGLVYWWTRNLWPLIQAHIIVDVVSVGVLKDLLG